MVARVARPARAARIARPRRGRRLLFVQPRWSYSGRTFVVNIIILYLSARSACELQSAWRALSAERRAASAERPQLTRRNYTLSLSN